MDLELKRLLEHAGILRRGTPTRLLLEEEDDDDAGGDDDDVFGGGDEGGDPFGDEDADAEGDAGTGEDSKREPPEELSATDIGNYGSPRFLDLEMKLKNMYNSCVTSAAAGAQHLEVYPGNAIPEEADDTPAKDEEPVEKIYKGERLHHLEIPSPYLTGVFDDIIANNPEYVFNATLETNRGCPFACTFCDWGSLTYA